MNTIASRVRLWMRAVFARQREDRDLAREMAAHIAMEREHLIGQGVASDEAERRARIAFGGVQRFTEDVRDERTPRWIDHLVQDVRYALRQYARAPLIAVTVIATLALGIGTSSWMFIIVDYYRPQVPAGVADTPGLVRVRGAAVWQQGPANRSLAYREIEELRAQSDVFSAVAAVTEGRGVILRPSGGEAIGGQVQLVTDGFLEMLGVRPALGRLLPPDIDGAGPATAFISYGLWRRAFGASPDALGKTIYVGGVSTTIVGVAPQGFKGGEGRVDVFRVDAWLPVSASRAGGAIGEPVRDDDAVFYAIARLRSGISVKRANAVAQSVGSHAAALYKRSPVSTTADVVPLLTTNRSVYGSRDAALFISLLAAASLLILAIVGTNVSALMLGRAAARQREIGVRISLGATRMRLVRQLLTESSLLSLGAAATGLAVLVIIQQFINREMVDDPISIGWVTVTGTAIVAIGMGVLCGLSPALHATRSSISDVLKGAKGSPRHTRSQRKLIIAQIALSQPLLVVLGLAVAAVIVDARQRFTSDAADHVIIMTLTEPDLGRRQTDSTAGSRFAEQAAKHLAEAVGVERVAIGATWTTGGEALRILPDGAGAVDEREFSPQLRPAGPGYFDVIGARIVRGREFDRTDIPGAPSGLIVGSNFARRYFGNTDPIGRRVACTKYCQTNEYVIVGVVDSVDTGPSGSPGRTYVYFAPGQRGRFSNPTLYARVRGDAASLVPALRARMVEAFPDVLIQNARTLASIDDAARNESTLTAAGAGGAGFIALLLAAVGLYGVVSFAVNQRTREIGVRIALGATPRGVVGHFFRDGVRLSVIGCGIGLPASVFAVGAFLSQARYQGPSPWLVGTAIAAVVTAIAMFATWLPARRAANVDPLTALRAE